MRELEIEVLGEQVFGDGGFARLRRLRVRNVRPDGGRSDPYDLDMVERPQRADAVTIIAYDRVAGAPRVLLRRGMRPVARLGRAGQATREGDRPAIEHIETVAGILEVGDLGEDGLLRRAAVELREEAGLIVDATAVRSLGSPVYISIGIMAERLYFCRVEAALHGLERPTGDGSPLEDGTAPLVLGLDEALARCERGEISDAKTELALRRLAQALCDEAGA
jgi:ADP-ribose pyrophosphatase